MTEEQLKTAELSAQIVDTLTAAAGLAKALLQTMVELRKGQAPTDAEAQIAKLKEELAGARGALACAQRECAEARDDRDRAEAIVVKLKARGAPDKSRRKRRRAA